MKGLALWITGLPGSGKSTLADEIKKLYPKFIILRMDAFRKIVTPKPAYSGLERNIVYRSLVYLAKIMTGRGHNVIIDATGNLRRWRTLARRLIPKYAEIYLKCPLEVAMKRERKRVYTHKAPKGIYKKGAKGWPVPGINVPYEEPKKPELTIETDVIPIKESIVLVKKLLFRLSRQ
ncbi:MAG: adenylyl-sulfate kinase [Nitrospirae bacterium]|nr:adenylyl-sulfate kinase [Nitrospirota bacterium]MBI3377765.1 adenylyl-sulfate kinase [Nitrospirota bacterium]